MKQMSTPTPIQLMAGALTALLLASNAMATPIGSDLSISGSASFDSVNLPAPTGNATQGGSLTRIVGGTTTTTTLNNTAVSGANPLSGSLTDIGDGFGIAFSGSGSNSNGASTFGDLFGDFAFSLSNLSLTDTYTVNLKVAFNRQVSSTAASPTNSVDAYGFNDLRLNDAANNNVFVRDQLLSDALNGNSDGSGYGGLVSDIGSVILSFILAPNSTIDLGDSSAELTVRGGAFDPGTSFLVDISTLITVDSVERRGVNPPNPTPEPATLALLGLGLAGLGLARRRA